MNDINKLFIQSGAMIKIYVGLIDYPIFYSNLLANDEEGKIIKENNLAWLVGCLNGQRGNEIKYLDNWWRVNSDFEYILK